MLLHFGELLLVCIYKILMIRSQLRVVPLLASDLTQEPLRTPTNEMTAIDTKVE